MLPLGQHHTLAGIPPPRFAASFACCDFPWRNSCLGPLRRLPEYSKVYTLGPRERKRWIGRYVRGPLNCPEAIRA